MLFIVFLLVRDVWCVSTFDCFNKDSTFLIVLIKTFSFAEVDVQL